MRSEFEFIETFLRETVQIAGQIDMAPIHRLVEYLGALSDRGGRLFILGVGGSAANASHAVNDFRKITGIETYAPTDNVSELTARTNDEGWETVFEAWLRGSHLNELDTILILSVSGGDEKKKMSSNLVRAIDYAKSVHADILGIVGSADGYTAKMANACVVVPVVNAAHVTPHSEAWQSVIWHLLVSHPRLKKVQTRFESVTDTAPSNRAVFIDRDGTLTTSAKSERYPVTALDACSSIDRLKKAGFKVFMVTNQPDINRGIISPEEFTLGTASMFLPPLDGIYMCPHTNANNCDCRKPKAGMLLQAAGEHNIDLSKSYMIGDTWRDAGAGFGAGCKKVFIVNSAKFVGQTALLDRYTINVASLTEAVAKILEDK